MKNRITSTNRLQGYDYQLYVDTPIPKWEDESIRALKGYCRYCGNKLTGRQRMWCAPPNGEPRSDCQWSIRSMGWWKYELGCTPLRRYIHRIFKFACQDCGKEFFGITPAGMKFAVFGGENHHILPLYQGGSDTADNMILLCKDCHKKRHARP